MKWSVLTLVGADQQGIVANVSRLLFDAGCQLAEASMLRLGGNFAIMLRVQHEAAVDLRKVLAECVDTMHLHLHIDEDVPAQPAQVEPDVHITVYGADRTGIVAEVTGKLAQAGLNIIDLESAVGGSRDKPIYIMSIEGSATRGIEVIQQAVEALKKDIDVSLMPVDTLRG